MAFNGFATPPAAMKHCDLKEVCKLSWVGVRRAVESLAHLTPADARRFLIDRCRAGLLPAKASIYTRGQSINVVFRHIDLQEAGVHFTGQLPNAESWKEKRREVTLPPEFFLTSHASEGTSERGRVRTKADWWAGDFETVEIIRAPLIDSDPGDTKYMIATNVMFEAELVAALAPDRAPAADRALGGDHLPVPVQEAPARRASSGRPANRHGGVITAVVLRLQKLNPAELDRLKSDEVASMLDSQHRSATGKAVGQEALRLYAGGILRTLRCPPD